MVHNENRNYTPKFKWNWGAFFLTVLWGIGNRTYIAILALIPIVNIFMSFYLGFNGDRLSWENKRWNDIDTFEKAQRKWSISGIAFFLIFLLTVGVSVFFFSSQISHDLNFELVQERLVESDLFIERVGEGYSSSLLNYKSEFSGDDKNVLYRMEVVGKERAEVLVKLVYTSNTPEIECLTINYSNFRERLTNCDLQK